MKFKALDVTPEMIRKMRKNFYTSTQEFAAAHGVSVSTVRSWEAGRTKPGPAHAQSLADEWQYLVDQGHVKINEKTP